MQVSLQPLDKLQRCASIDSRRRPKVGSLQLRKRCGCRNVHCLSAKERCSCDNQFFFFGDESNCYQRSVTSVLISNSITFFIRLYLIKYVVNKISPIVSLSRPPCLRKSSRRIKSFIKPDKLNRSCPNLLRIPSSRVDPSCCHSRGVGFSHGL
jgi:hypothetical protein